MSLDTDLAERLLGTDDRDVARFFAGRQTEIASFDAAVRFAADKPQATFRIYQGAPGCGKTSLANHLARTRSKDLLFVTVDPEHLRTADTLRMRIRAASLASGHTASRIGSTFVELVSAHLKSTVAADGLRAETAKIVARGKSRLVLHLDEAHARALDCGDVLRDLHASGIGVPCVVLMTGLGHTKRTVASIPGLSRLGDNAVVEMGAMSPAECAQSTAAMVEALMAAGTPAERDAAAALAAELAQGWPQHLRSAQKALCGELVRVGGRLQDIDAERIKAEADSRRAAYYAERLDHPIFEIDPVLALRVVVDVASGATGNGRRLEHLCEDAIADARLSELFAARGATATQFADALFEKGVLSRGPRRNEWSVAIPSMAVWAAGELGTDDGTTTTGHGTA